MRSRIPPIRELVRAMADPQIPCTGEDGVDSVALDIATQYGRVDVVRELVEQFGVRGCGGSSRGNDALRWAAQTGHADVSGRVDGGGWSGGQWHGPDRRHSASAIWVG